MTSRQATFHVHVVTLEKKHDWPALLNASLTFIIDVCISHWFMPFVSLARGQVQESDLLATSAALFHSLYK